MRAKHLLPVAGVTATALAATALALASTGPSSSESPYLVGSQPGVSTTSILTVGDSVGGYRMVGIPDGLGAFDNHDGTFTVLMNHELQGDRGAVRDHGAKGAFVSKWVIDKDSLSVVSGGDLIQQVRTWNPVAGLYNAAAKGVTFVRLCSADLAKMSAFYEARSRKGYDGRLLLNGEESGGEGRAFAHALDGTSYELPYLGKASWENIVANPAGGTHTVTAGTDDGTGGQVYIYVGNKRAGGLPVEKAGLVGGDLYGVSVDGITLENAATGIPSGSRFSLAKLGDDGDVSSMTGAALETASDAANATEFLRPEDAAWDPDNPGDLYFVTTASFSGNSRLWRLRFDDIANPAAGGTIDMLLDGTETGGTSERLHMLDNITVSRGRVLMQEDPGNQDYLARVWQYDILADRLTQVAVHDPSRFTPGAADFLTKDEESSGIIPVDDILGRGWYLADTQAHFTNSDPGLVEGGQLMAIHIPARRARPFTYAVIGDTPYGSAQIANFPNDVAEINADSDVSLVLHLGDIKNGSSRCDDSYFSTIRTAFDGFARPLVYTPGDNEWTDCHRANNGGYVPTERLTKLREIFFDQPGRTLGNPAMDVEAQDAPNSENVTWSRSRVQFGTVNVPGSNNDWLPWFGAASPSDAQVAEYTDRNAADLAWLDHIFRQADRNGARALVIGIQADMWDPAFSGANDLPAAYDHFTEFVGRLARNSERFGRPVLLLNGDSHSFVDEYPLADAAKTYQRTMYGITRPVRNLRRITINGSTTPCHEWLKLSIDPASKDVFTPARELFDIQPGFSPLVCPPAQP